MAVGGALNKREAGFEHEKTMQLKAPGARKRNIDFAASKGRGYFERAYVWLTLCRLIEHTKVPTHLTPGHSFSLLGIILFGTFVTFKVKGSMFNVRVYVQV
jgi:hypothetical protein